MNRRHFFAVAAGSAAFSLLLPRPSFARGRHLGKAPRPDLPGYFYFYDFSLKHFSEGQYPMQAELVKAEGKTELLKWGSEPNFSYALRFEPEKAGDAITFRIHIGSVSRA